MADRNIIKSETFNISEKMLAKWGDRVFLPFWSFANVYTDEGIKIEESGARKGQGEELCDLLVVFENHVIIFSDKGQVEYKPNNDVNVSWRRWVDRAFLKSAYSIYRAERWIKERPNRIYLDKECNEPFPINIPSPGDMIVHRIAIARGITEHAKKFYQNKSCTLLLKPDVVGKEHYEKPFIIGIPDQKKGYVHFLDEVSIDIIFQELDTLRDFTRYLTHKEKLINNDMLLFAPGEVELLGYYLSSREDLYLIDSPKFIIPSNRTDEPIAVQPGFYEGHKATEEYLKIKEIIAPSYFWDKYINIMGPPAFTGKWHETNGENYDEEITVLKYMASESRIARAILSNAFLEISGVPFTNNELHPRVRACNSPTNESICYVFLIMKKSHPQQDYAEYRENRKAAISSYCIACKDAFPQFETIVGIACDAIDNGGSSEELIYLHTNDWTDEDFANARYLREEFGLLKNVKPVVHSLIPRKETGESELSILRKNRKRKNKLQKAARKKNRR